MSYDYSLGCIIRGFQRNGADIDSIENVANHSECNDHCKRRQDCSVWQYNEGSCYIKSGHTFKTTRNYSVSGITNCKSSKKEGKLATMQSFRNTDNF